MVRMNEACGELSSTCNLQEGKMALMGGEKESDQKSILSFSASQPLLSASLSLCHDTSGNSCSCRVVTKVDELL